MFTRNFGQLLTENQLAQLATQVRAGQIPYWEYDIAVAASYAAAHPPEQQVAPPATIAQVTTQAIREVQGIINRGGDEAELQRLLYTPEQLTDALISEKAGEVSAGNYTATVAYAKALDKAVRSVGVSTPGVILPSPIPPEEITARLAITIPVATKLTEVIIMQEVNSEQYMTSLDFTTSAGFTGKIVISEEGGRLWSDYLQTWTDIKNILFDSDTNTMSFRRQAPGGTQQWTGVISGDQISGTVNGSTWGATITASTLPALPSISPITPQEAQAIARGKEAIVTPITPLLMAGMPTWGWIALAGIGLSMFFGKGKGSRKR